MTTARKQISKKAAATIGGLFNSINCAKSLMDAADLKTQEGSEQYIRWELNLMEAVAELKTVYGIVVPFWTDAISERNLMLSSHRALYGHKDTTDFSLRMSIKHDRIRNAVAADMTVSDYSAEKVARDTAFLTENRSFNV